MGLNLSHQNTLYADLREHINHKIVCVYYGPDMQNVAIECETCDCVLLDADRPNEKGDES